jgi:hypothetical protein
MVGYTLELLGELVHSLKHSGIRYASIYARLTVCSADSSITMQFILQKMMPDLLEARVVSLIGAIYSLYCWLYTVCILLSVGRAAAVAQDHTPSGMQ